MAASTVILPIAPNQGLCDLIQIAPCAKRRRRCRRDCRRRQNDDHETINDVVLAEAWADIADLREASARHAGKAGAERKREHVDAISTDAERGSHGTILHDGADLQAKGSAREEPVCEQDDEAGEADDEDAVVGEKHIVNDVAAAQPTGGTDLDIGGAEDMAENLLQDEADAPGREQRFEGAPVEKANDAAFEDEADETRRDKEQASAAMK